MKSEHLEVVVKGSNFSIEWDDDSLRISNSSFQTTNYKLYYRSHGSSYWKLLDEIEAKQSPSYTFREEILDFGKYDLGVSSVNSSGKESAIHSSLDMSADPFCGWYVNWIGSK